jgi:hypothetical protein
MAAGFGTDESEAFMFDKTSDLTLANGGVTELNEGGC